MTRTPRSRTIPDLALEFEFDGLVCGVDEAGRGPLAGPVVAAAVILDPARLPDGIDDSKVLTAERRERAFADILRCADVAFAFASSREIDALNIRRATLLAMRRAVCALAVAPNAVLVDGRDVPPGLSQATRAVIGGDGLSLSIGAASIVAKVVRDRVMRRLDAEDPRYGFSRHMGYPTADHRAAIERHGPSRHHRMTFGMLKATRLPNGR